MSAPICFTVVNDEGYEVEHSLPSRWEICDRCRGNGKHDHPAFANGLTQEDFDQDPDFREEYMRGRYDVRCDECRGAGKVLVPDEAVAEPGLLALYRAQREQQARWDREDAYTRRMENGGAS
jgi:hypothetical protein